jgi:hypothetical protein
MTPRQIALQNIIDAVCADIGNGAEYLTQHPKTHETLPARTAEAVERHMHKILDGLAARLQGKVIRRKREAR